MTKGGGGGEGEEGKDCRGREIGEGDTMKWVRKLEREELRGKRWGHGMSPCPTGWGDTRGGGRDKEWERKVKYGRKKWAGRGRVLEKRKNRLLVAG